MEAGSRNGSDALKLNMRFVEELLVKFLHDETTAAGFAKGVVGLSGGVDSAVVAALAAKGLGKQNVLGIILPYSTSSDASTKDAILVAKEVGIKTETIDISPMVDAYCQRQKIKDNVRRGNVMARVRMIMLYDVSAREQGLVIGTSNKTELMLGYGTLHGDMASAVNPVGDLYKTQIWHLAEWLGLPKHIIEKKPTADLWAGQTDEGELGFKYADLDRLLYYMIDERRTDEELSDLGFRTEFVGKMRKTVRKNQFKRSPPVIAKISYRTVNVDFRYVRDWGI